MEICTCPFESTCAPRENIDEFYILCNDYHLFESSNSREKGESKQLIVKLTEHVHISIGIFLWQLNA